MPFCAQRMHSSIAHVRWGIQDIYRRHRSRCLIKSQNADEKRVQLQAFVVNAQSEFFAPIGHEGRVSNYIGA